MILAVMLTVGCQLATVNGFYTMETVHSTKVFTKTIGPWSFNWTDSKSVHQPRPGQFSYRPSLLDAPDLPSWMYYTHNDDLNRGYLYGAPPAHQKNFQIEIIGLNKNTYETERSVIMMNVIEITDAVVSEVQLKVDRLDIEDMLSSNRLNLLLDVFRKTLWPESDEDLLVTYLASAIHLGARLPLNPTDGEGIVMHFGSQAPFSQYLLDLQEEVRPLHSKGLTNCPDFKHTSVERFFKQHNFSLDWCAFHLVDKRKSEKELSQNHPPVLDLSNSWQPVSKAGLPTRHYVSEMFPTVAAYLVTIIMSILLLNVVFCYWDDKEPTGDSTPIQYEATQKASNTLRSLSTEQDLDEPSPRVSSERPSYQPNPPPYSALHQLPADNNQEDEEARTWYC